jgi:hypothetical protein
MGAKVVSVQPRRSQTLHFGKGHHHFLSFLLNK